MALMADRVRETTTTAGTGTVTLDGAVTGYQSFGTAFGSGALVYYVIAGPVEWEIGIGTTGAGTLARTTVLQSTNADALVPFSAGTKDVFCAYVADRAVTTVDAAELTNKTIDSYTNYVGANQLHLKCKAMANLAKGTVCKITGWNAGENAVEVDAMTSTADLAFGVMYTTLTTGSFGELINTGYLEGINTNAYAPGTILYPNGTGGFTSTKPTSGTYQACAYVLRQQSVNGVIYVEFTNPSQVEASTNTGNTLVLRDGSGNFAAGTITAAAQVVTGDLTVDTSTLKVDSANNRVGVGTATPAAPLDVVGPTDYVTLRLTQTKTDSNQRVSMVAQHAVLSEEAVFLIGAANTTINRLFIGGASNAFNAASQIEFYTAATSTTLAGTQRWLIDQNGHFFAGADATYDIGGAAGSRPRNVYTSGDAFFAGVRVGRGLGAITSNTAVGAFALSANTTGADNTAVGASALVANTTGASNVAVGRSALITNTEGTANTAVGVGSLLNNLTGNSNTSTGQNALAGNTTGTDNTAVGRAALAANTTGLRNVAIGRDALAANTTASESVAVGRQALLTNTTGSQNVAVGNIALLVNSTGSNNVAVGPSCLVANTTGVSNTAVGRSALGAHTTGTLNVAVGRDAANLLTTGERNTILGSSCQASAAAGNDQTVVGEGLTGKGNDTAFIGGVNGAYNEKNVTTWEVTSDARLKRDIVDNHDGLNKINAIRVRNFTYRTPDEVLELPASAAIDKPGVQLGVIAQEMLPECVSETSEGVKSVSTDAVLWYLVNAVQQLSATVETLKQELGR